MTLYSIILHDVILDYTAKYCIRLYHIILHIQVPSLALPQVNMEAHHTGTPYKAYGIVVFSKRPCTTSILIGRSVSTPADSTNWLHDWRGAIIMEELQKTLRKIAPTSAQKGVSSAPASTSILI